ncbi:hypothetical protein AYI69_g4954 [Smittium culicis]|uniref:Uncharacterized protein n=1 Tax=Smittium culicis TaxID=133412 RepID=A0A1R1YA17_9FUNG|nr:hypothetical protein AYI69_g4954 [Smittium culicis]
MFRSKLSSSPPVFFCFLMLKNIRDVANMGSKFTINSLVIHFATPNLFLSQEKSDTIIIPEATMGYYLHNKLSYSSDY